jgi:hypothetical protein
MGWMRFLVGRGDRITQDVIDRAYLSGLEQVPWQSRLQWTADCLSIERGEGDSGRLHIPWKVEGFGELVLSTAVLIQREEPYLLEVELARGTIGHVSDQAAEWQVIGLALPTAVTGRLSKAIHLMGRAATTQHDPAAAVECAEQALATALEAGIGLGACYTQKALEVRHRQTPKLPTLFGAHLGATVPDDKVAGMLQATFNAGMVPMTWRGVEANEGGYHWETPDRQIDWCRSRGLGVCGGPLLQFDPAGLPDWLYLWQGDYAGLTSFAAEYVKQAVTRYRGKVDLWLCAARMNVGEALSLAENERLGLAIRTLEITRSLDPDAQAAICFDQPWAEYMSRQSQDLSPLQFAEALIRAGLGLKGIGLEINYGYHPRGTLPRDIVEFGRHLDRWGMLGLPLYLMLTLAGDDCDDPRARVATKPFSGGWLAEGPKAWVKRFVELALAKPYVHGIFWNQLLDSEPHDYPHGGLFDAAGRPKLVLGALASLRLAHLK